MYNARLLNPDQNIQPRVSLCQSLMLKSGGMNFWGNLCSDSSSKCPFALKFLQQNRSLCIKALAHTMAFIKSTKNFLVI